MALTPETLPRHELAGLRVRVAAADDPGLVGVEGRVVGETTRTLRIESDDGDAGGEDADRGGAGSERAAGAPAGGETATGGVRQVPKAGTTFEFALPASAGGGHVTVAGDRLVARPAERTETAGDSKWR